MLGTISPYPETNLLLRETVPGHPEGQCVNRLQLMLASLPWAMLPPPPNLSGREVGSESCISVRLRFHFLESAELSYLPICFPQSCRFCGCCYIPYPHNINKGQATADFTCQYDRYHPKAMKDPG